jgi:DNA polymerase IV
MTPMTHPSVKYQGFNVGFNQKPSTLMHIDLNSCFATIEQQANPMLRGKPVAVAAYNTPSGCILAASIEAKKLGINTGLRVKDGRMLCPGLIVKTPDPWKYRNVHLSLKQLLSEYTNELTPKSIDEFILNLEGYPSYTKGMHKLGTEIKQRIKAEIGDWLTVSIGIGPNRFLAKTAANLHKPDGLDEINADNAVSVYAGLKLEDLHGIAGRNASRLQQVGIHTVLNFYHAPITTLKSAFRSILSYYWYIRIRGWEIDDVDVARRSYGNSYALPKPFKTEAELTPILTKLTEKMTFRLRQAGWHAGGVHLAIVYRDHSFWHQGMKIGEVIFESRDVYKHIMHLFRRCPYRKPVAQLAVSVFNLTKSDTLQLDLFGHKKRQETISQALDSINERWGQYVMTPARMLGTGDNVPDRIAFGGMKELEEFTLKEISDNIN